MAGTGLVMAVLRADTRRENHRMVRNRMETATAVRREIGQTARLRTVTIQPGKVMILTTRILRTATMGRRTGSRRRSATKS
ncbi:hypothetical protein A5760_11620 [Mycobacterium colombiense]|uniref:Uncharacterized protein n=1 Tax=Mycobacterium colombiense TaxID=339268 RepID=A0A1A0VI02_9MYCO|nr:hypothetical protein A5760_11620 [Mycobacterium colombiense]